ncbi:MAG: hypothetical protein U5M51_14560 [Emticicia sp.]|nr:hypothetical protein [Emticicia sp.]
MRNIGPIGKKSYTGKKFRKAGPNELNASDKNFIRKNINLFNIQILAVKVAKPVSAVEKFIKKEKLTSIIEIKEIVSVEAPLNKLDKAESPKEKKTDKLVKKNLQVEVLPDKVESPKEKKADKLVKKNLQVEVLPDKVESPKEKKADKLVKKNLPVKVLPSKLDSSKSSKAKEETKLKRNDIVAKKVDFIRENYQKYSAVELAKMLNASITGVRYHLKNLNVVKTPYKFVKTPPETILKREKFIKENHKKYTVRELSEQLNCSCDIIRLALRKLNVEALRVPLGQEISPQAINFIKANYRTMTAREMSDALGNVRWTQIKYLCEKYGFLKTPDETTAIRNRWNRSEFTVSEEKYIIMNHGIIPLSEIAKNLERTRSSVIKLLARKGLKITKEQHDILNRKNFEKGRITMKAQLEAKRAAEK